MMNQLVILFSLALFGACVEVPQEDIPLTEDQVIDDSDITDVDEVKISEISIKSTNQNSNIAKSGDSLKLRFKAYGDLDPQVKIQDKIVPVVDMFNGYYEASHTLIDSYEGNAHFEISYLDNLKRKIVYTETNDFSSVYVDTIKPSIHLDITSSSQGTILKSGDSLEFNLTSNESVDVVLSSVSSQVTTLTKINNKIFNKIVGSSVLADGVVKYEFQFKDIMGNLSDKITHLDNVNVYSYTSTPPSLDTVRITSNNTTQSLARAGDELTLFFSSADSLQDIDVSIGGLDVNNILKTGSNAWEAKLVVPESLNDGLVNFTIEYKNEGGLSGSIVSKTTDLSSVTVDTTLPEILSTKESINDDLSISEANAGDVFKLSWEISESNNYSQSVKINGENAIIQLEESRYEALYDIKSTDVGYISYQIEVIDESGNLKKINKTSNILMNPIQDEYNINLVDLLDNKTQSNLPIIPKRPAVKGMDTVAGSGRHLETPQTTVYKVTNLNTSGPGSLQEGIDATGPRTIVFEVSGSIDYTPYKRLMINNPYLNYCRSNST